MQLGIGKSSKNRTKKILGNRKKENQKNKIKRYTEKERAKMTILL